MSGNDQMKWDDNLDFESLADEHEGGSGDEFTAEGAGDLQDLAYDAEPQAEAEDPLDEADGEFAGDVEAPAGESFRPEPFRRRAGMPSIGMGLLFGLATIASALGLANAALMVTGTDPRIYWNPQALMELEPWMNLQSHPLHVFYLVAVGIVAVAWLIAWRVVAYSRRMNRNLRNAEDLLARVSDLRLDNETAWQHPAFKADPALEAFVVETLGAWRLQIARQDKNVALEGELRRLEQAAASGVKANIESNYEHPLVGQLADLLVSLYGAKASAEQEIEAVRTKDQHESASILGVIQDARSWNRHTLDQLSVQAASVAGAAGALEQAAGAGTAGSGANPMAQVSLSLRELKDEIEALAASETEAHDPGARSVSEQLTELTERGGKLAFQIAMEVASLGDRGERLLPMAQALEELTTEFRESATRLAGGQDQPEMPRYPEMVRKLDGLIGLLESAPAPQASPLDGRIDELSETVRRASSDLELLAGSFNHQSTRLSELGASFAKLTGQGFDPDDLQSGRPDNPATGSLSLNQMDPFAADQGAPESSSDIDPFATADSVLEVGSTPVESEGFAGDVTPQAEPESETSFGSVDPFAEPEQEPAAGIAPEPAPEAVPEATLSPAEEKVYDLTEFDAQRLDAEASDEGTEERIYDLAEFGAVALS